MHGVVSLVVASVVGGGLWAGLSLRTSEARAERFDAPVPVAAALGPIAGLEPVEPTPEQRRAELNQRLQTMISEGRGARLQDATTRPVRAVRTAGGSRYTAPRLDLTTAPTIPNNDLDCLTQAIYYEARNESEAGQTAVAEVVMNRVRHPGYPDQVCAVVYQRNSRTCQFTFTCDGSMGRGAVRQAAWTRAQRIAREVLEGRHESQLPSSSVNYHANYVRPTWGQRLAKVRQIGAHIFYGTPKGREATPGSSLEDRA